METPPSGMPSPPLSPHGTPSSLSSDFPSLEGSIYSVLAPDSPCSEPRDYHYYRHNNNNNVAGGGFSSHDVHHEAMRHLILPSLTLQQQREASSRALSGTASVAGFGDYGSSSRQTGIAALPSVGEPSRSSIHHHAVSAIEPPENVRLLVIGRRGAGKTFLCENLVQGSVEGFAWTYEPSLGKVLSQTTPIDEKRRNGLKIVRLDGWNESDEPSQVLDSILATIHQPFRELDQVLHPTAVQSTASVNLSIDLLTSTAAPLYTAAIVVLSPHPTAIETSLLRTLSQHIPVIPFSPHQQRRRRHHSPDYFNDSRAQSRHRSHHQPQYSRHASPYRGIHSRAPSIPRFLTPISDSPRQQQAPLPNFAFHPTSHRALKEWLFDEVNLKGLRREAAEKFLTWRERERSVEAYLPTLNASRDDYTPPHNNTMHGAQFMDHIVAPVLPLDAFERFTFDQIFTPSDFESADLDSEVEAEVERESEAESRARPAVAAAAALPTDDEGEADAESRAQSDAEGGLLARAQYLHSDADAESESDNNNRTWEADLSRMVALRKREREHFSRMETIRPSSFHHFQSHHSLRRPLSEVVPTHTEADNLLLFHPNQQQHHLPSHHHHQNDTPDYESLEHGEAGYQTASSDVGPLSSSSAFPPTTTTASSDPNPSATGSPSEGAIDLASLDPLHIPSLLSLALSILPEIKTRIVAKIKFWILPAAFTLPRHSTDLDEKLAAGAGGGQVWDEKRGLVDDERENSDRRGGGGDARPTAIMLSLPAVGAIAAAAAALGFWAGVTVDGRAGFLTFRSL